MSNRISNDRKRLTIERACGRENAQEEDDSGWENGCHIATSIKLVRNLSLRLHSSDLERSASPRSRVVVVVLWRLLSTSPARPVRSGTAVLGGGRS